MSFVDPVFLLFFAVVFCVHWGLARWHRAQNAWIAAVSLVFYGWVHPWLVGLLLYSSLMNFGLGLAVERDPDRRDTWLGLSVFLNLGTLGFFKYFNFFQDAVVAALQTVGFAAHPTTWQIFLPVGLSFYTFHAMAYVIDVWRGQFKARTDLVGFLVFIGLFPQLVAGPIARAHALLPQVENPRTFQLEQVLSGLGLALWGAFKKIVLADTMAPYVNIIYAHDDPSWAMIWSAALGFAIQVLADFTGYTDMARGTARMLGFELLDNFDHPYLATSPMDFWQRWHISFSTWLRDYVYMPASFSPWVRRWITLPGTGDWTPFWHTARSLTLTMLISGIWHGSTWNYIAWGLYYAVIGTVWAWAQQRIPRKTRKSRDWTPYLVPLMFLHTLVGMMIFREPSVARLVTHFLKNPLGGSPDTWIVTGGMLMMCAFGAIPLLLALAFETYALPKLKTSPWYLPFQTTAFAAAIAAIAVFYRPTSNDFVYFQF
jgi:D-alanyl-lipoteichoic acid acyltransferase DltB (MBOAT superfamily)